MASFKGRHFKSTIILQCVRRLATPWYCKYGISRVAIHYRDLEEMMLERGVEVDHSTIYRWVQRYASEMEKALRWYKKGFCTHSWRPFHGE